MKGPSKSTLRECRQPANQRFSRTLEFLNFLPASLSTATNFYETGISANAENRMVVSLLRSAVFFESCAVPEIKRGRNVRKIKL